MAKIDKREKEAGVIDIKLNLIPPEQKKKIKKNRRLKKIFKAEIVLTCIMLVLTGTLFSFYYILNMELNSQIALSSDMEKADQFDKIKNYDKQFSEANNRIKQIIAVDKAQLYWSGVFVKLSQLALSGITIKSIKTQDYQMTISGTADTRDNLLSFKDNLDKEDCFSDVNLPLSSLVNKTDVDFQIIFDVDDKCLKRPN